jgi:hypothetical protein
MSNIPALLRSEAISRAQRRCEYCQMPDNRELNAYSHEVDYIIVEKHGGKAETDNLAYASFQCNRHKGTDITSIDPQTRQVVQLFNPRTQRWDDHFRLNEDGTIASLTAEGRTTASLLKLNDPVRAQIRADLLAAGKLNLTHGQS